MKLNLGVLDVTYSEAHGSGEQAQLTSTGDVATILEANYGVMAAFYESRKEKIANWLAEDMAQSLTALMSGRRIAGSGGSTTYQKQFGQKRRTLTSRGRSLTYGADQKIETEFRAFIFADELSKIQGAPVSAAAVAGVSHRKKQPFAKANKARPAFVDTGLYVASFRAWSEE